MAAKVARAWEERSRSGRAMTSTGDVTVIGKSDDVVGRRLVEKRTGEDKYTDRRKAE